MKTLSTCLCAMAFILGVSVNTDALLIDRGAGLIYDDVLDITWLQDANYAQTSDYDDGLMNWYEATACADQLAYGGYDDWRLPTTVDGLSVPGFDGTTTSGWNITTSEMGYMYYVNLGNLGYYDTDGTYPQPGWGLNNSGPFTNLIPYAHWSGTEYSLDTEHAWTFMFSYGDQNGATKVAVARSWAVRDGDVAAPVPEPSTMLLLGSGLIGLAALRKKARK